MSFKLKISLLVSTLLLSAVGGFAAVLILSEKKILADGLASQQLNSVAGLADVCRDAIVSQEDLLLTNYLKRLKSAPDVLEALCAKSNGVVVGHTDVRLIRTALPEGSAEAGTTPEIRANRRGDGDVVEALAPAKLGARAVGTALIAYDRGRMRERLEREFAAARRRIVGLSIPVMILGFAGAFAVTALMVRPVSALVEGVRVISAGRMDHRIPAGRPDELGLLAREFNRMAGRLGELDAMKRDFVSGITHDLKSPLSSIKTAADLIRREAEEIPRQKADPKRVAENLFMIQRDADRLLNLITSILDVAHIESGLELNRSPSTLEEIAHRAVRGLELIARQKGLTLDLLVESQLSPLRLDEGKMERVAANLIGNAVKFTPAGGVIVRVRQQNGRQELSVSDTGPGIPPEFLKKLFTKFSRAEGTGRKVEGSGLGLSIAKGIVEAHGGTIGVESPPGKGTTFTLSLPMEES